MGFSNIINFRDLGGLLTNDNRKIKSGLFYRGSCLDFYTANELDQFKKLNIKTIMDLRSAIEIETFPDPVIEGSNYIKHNGMIVEGHSDIDWSPAGMKKIEGEAYLQISKIHSYYRNIAFNNTALRLMVDEIKKENLPIYFHCAMGKDRTGVAAIIILLLLNVKEELIRKDYLLSNDFRKEIIEESLEEVKDQIIDHPELKKLIIMQQGVDEGIYDVVIDSILDRYESFDEYITKEFDVDSLQLKNIRDRYSQL